MDVLHLTLYKQWFDQILTGEKKVECRNNTLYWGKRILLKLFDYIHFVNGYGKDRPWMDVEFKYTYLNWDVGKEVGKIEIHLGRVLRSGNLREKGGK